MTKRIIEPDIPRHIKIKRSCLTSLGTARDIKNEMETLQFFDERSGACFIKKSARKKRDQIL